MTLAQRPDAVLTGDAVVPTETGLQFVRDLSYDEWAEYGVGLQVMGRAWQWWVGDWLNYGERRWGEKYAQAVEADATTGLGVEAIRKAAWVAENVPFVLRNTNLSWSHHYAVAPLAADDQRAYLDTAEAEGWSVAELRQAIKDSQRNAPPELPAGKFRTVVADPPWQYDNVATRGAAEDHYSTMTLEEVMTLDVQDRTADDAHLYLWTTNGFLDEAFDVMTAWGFAYKTCLTWVKPQIGMGNYFRSATEHVLFGTRGSLPIEDRTLRNWFEAPRGRHSAKPDMFYDLVEKASPGPYLEMFARRRRFNWEVWGDEA